MNQAPVIPDQQIRRLMPRHFKILELAIAGHDVKTIAETVGLATRSVTLIMKSPLFQAEITRRRKEVNEEGILGMDRQATLGKARSILEQATEYAALKQVSLMESDDQSLQFKAASAILDRAFGKTGESNGGMVVNISAEQVQLLNVALKESDYAIAKRFQSADSSAPADSEGASGPGPGDVHQGSAERA